jgi:hypothetical protein
MSGFLAVTGCTAGETASQRSADAHAVTAGEVMSRGGRPPISASDAAWAVVGTGVDDTINALSATGTTYAGSVVLRITVNHSTFDEYTSCYRYSFKHSVDDFRPAKLKTCPTSAPLTLTSPPPEPVVDTPARIAALTALLHHLTPAQRNDPASIRSELVAIFPPPISVYADKISDGTVEVGARTFDTCVAAYVSPQDQVSVHPAHGADCHGG